MKYLPITVVTFLMFLLLHSLLYAQATSQGTRAYCFSYAVALNDEDIFNVTFGTLNNTSDCSTTGGAGSMINQYSNYTGIVAPPDISRNSLVPFSISTGTCGDPGNNAIKIFIDYNQDGDYTDPGENVYTTPASIYGPHTESGNIAVPLATPLGLTNMRIVNSKISNPAVIAPCGNYNYGETEDYKINIVPGPCYNPSMLTAANITTNSADLSWIENSGATEWQFEWGTQGFTHGNGTLDTTTHNPYILNGLSPNTHYDFYARSICSAGDSSSWEGPLTFTTDCNAFPIPFSGNFDLVVAPVVSDCWKVTNNNGDAYAWQTSASYSMSAPNSMYIRYNAYAAMNDWFFTPALELTGGQRYIVKFYYKSGGYYSEMLEVKWGASPDSAGMSGGLIFDNNNISNSSYVLGSGIFTPSANGNYYVGFHGYSGPDQWFISIDNISVKISPFSDLDILADNDTHCDTLGWFNPPITIANVGLDTLLAGENIICTYQLESDPVVADTFQFLTDIYPGDTASFTFGVPVQMNQFATQNVRVTFWYFKDQNPLNDTAGYTVTTNPVPFPGLTGIDTLCLGDTTILYTTDTLMANYNWMVSPGGNIIEGGGPADLFVKVYWISAGAQSVSVNYENAFGCPASVPTVLPIAINLVPVVNLGNDTLICGLDVISLDAGNPGCTYFWWDSVTTQNHPVDVSDCVAGDTCTFTVMVTNNTCIASGTIDISFMETPVLNIVADTFICDDNDLTLDAGGGFDSYEWSTGEVTQTITVDSTGYGPGTQVFWIDVTKNACTSRDSGAIVFTLCTGIADNAKNNILIEPNPTSGTFNIHFNDYEGKVSLSILTIQGKPLFVEKLYLSGQPYIKQMDISHLPKGVYFIKVHDDNGMFVSKLVIE